jgi:hypothetical protein
MPSAKQRNLIGVLAASLAIVSAVCLVQGIKGDSLLLAIGALTFVVVAGLVGWWARNARSGAALDGAEMIAQGDPKPASAPPDGHIRFTIVVDNLPPARVAELWSDLCRPNREVTEAFRLLYRNFTVLDGNRFRFMKGEPQATAGLLAEVLSTASATSVRTSIEPAAERTPLWS